MPAALPDFIRIRLERAGIRLDSGDLSAVAIYLGLLTKWNETVNLTALELNPASDDAIDRLLIEPLLAAQAARRLIDFATAGLPLKLLDVGSGGGSPAIPLTIAFRSAGPVELRMVESRSRKAAFLRDVVRQIPLPGAEVFNARLEDLAGRPELRKAFDAVSMRAVRANGELWETLNSLLGAQGRILWFRSATGEREPTPSFTVEATSPLLETSELVVLRKAG